MDSKNKITEDMVSSLRAYSLNNHDVTCILLTIILLFLLRFHNSYALLVLHVYFFGLKLYTYLYKIFLGGLPNRVILHCLADSNFCC